MAIVNFFPEIWAFKKYPIREIQKAINHIGGFRRYRGLELRPSLTQTTPRDNTLLTHGPVRRYERAVVKNRVEFDEEKPSLRTPNLMYMDTICSIHILFKHKWQHVKKNDGREEIKI